MALRQLSKVEQRYRAVLAVQAGDRVTEVAWQLGVSRQSVHAWLARYAESGLAGLEDRSHQPFVCPHQMPPAVEAELCELRRQHPGWGPARLAYLLAKRGVQRGSLYNSFLEFYVRSRRFAEAEDVAQRARDHYEQARAPLLSFYILLHQAIMRLMMGDALTARKHAADAADCLARIPFESPNDARLLRRLAICQAKLGNEREAFTNIERAVALDPEDVTVIYNRAVVYSLTGRAEEALGQLRQALARGYSRAEAERDPDLDDLRDAPAYKALFAV